MTMPAPAELPRDTIQVLLLENIHPSATETFHAFAEGRTYAITRKSSALKEDELIAALPGVQLLGIRSKTRITARVLENARDLLSVGCFCIGTNQVDLVAANARGVPVFNAPFSNTRSVAELMIGEIIVLARQLGDRSREVHAGVWKKVAAQCYEVRGKVLGIIGYGHIGRQLGVLAEAVGMRVLYHDIAARLPMGNNRSVPSLAALLAESDFVSLHVPETPETRNMIGAAELAKMRKGSYLLNASRGTVVDIAALVASLESGHLAGAAIDVYPEEPESNTDQFKTDLQSLSNVLLTPHIGGSTEEAQEAIGREVAAVLGKFAAMGATTGSVNFPQVELPPVKGTHRILNVHRNEPGVLRDVNRVVADLNANIDSQFLATEGAIGYLIMDLEQDVSAEVSRRIQALPSNIRTRVVY
ncbi:phosphoglycerate dehydrogenase [Polyangium sp. 15x6]|nr:phosphoglycerate dehydrogenase [Polyangium sp. 15x6]MDI3282186.1 phosphoglycerate dehydrogenase [Polyangium sp. 15x6]